MNEVFLIIAFIVNIPIIIFVQKKIFKTNEEIIKNIEYENKPDLVSVYDGSILEDMKYRKKNRSFTFILCLIGLAEYGLFKGVMWLIDKM
ncbi:hypothetical protein EZV73_04775 [Acidaminobacter sp. JC074]|uniref:hypothetical protein n=1 Tax=Acidaminobacter sp. JC074 TaxID=2530199 RepID=UPI001F0D9630|nr:hypothetical protein [Acidaminobacter sp. JC074]MCH4886868.1 hypothetical protein [Acidaminobacter sp. JC074]